MVDSWLLQVSGSVHYMSSTVYSDSHISNLAADYIVWVIFHFSPFINEHLFSDQYICTL